MLMMGLIDDFPTGKRIRHIPSHVPQRQRSIELYEKKGSLITCFTWAGTLKACSSRSLAIIVTLVTFEAAGSSGV